MDTIVIDDIRSTATPSKSSLSHIIDLEDDNSNDVEILEVHKPVAKDQFLYDIYRENKDLAVLIEKCISLDISGGMYRVMRKTLVPIYQATNDAFKKSIVFERALTKVMCRIETDPTHKFSHIKDFCDFLKDNVSKRKVPLKTLSRKTSEPNIDKVNQFKKHRHKRLRRHHKRVKNPVLNSVDECNGPPTIDFELDAHVNNAPYSANMEITDLELDAHVNNVPYSANMEITDLELDAHVNNVPYSASMEIIDLELDAHVNNVPYSACMEITDHNHVVDNEKENASANIEINLNETNKAYSEAFIEFEVPNITNTLTNEENVHLKPMYSQIFQNTTPNSEEELTKKINLIEKQIQTFKILVDEMNEAEVTEDNDNSPYIQAEYYKSKIVKLYKQLCVLTGQDSVKRRKVRLKAKDSRSTLPLMKLQSLINSKIGSDGLPHFPDFEEVVQCVDEANCEGNLSWDSKRILGEARALFTYCGRALQRGRQRREWRDMMSMVKSETLEDPAEKDPELEAKLERNRLVAIKKEEELLNAYASMETRRYRQALTDNHMQVEMENSEDEVEHDQISISNVVSYANPNTPPSNAKQTELNAKEPVSNNNDQMRESVVNPLSSQVQSNDSVQNTHLNFMAIGYWNISEPLIIVGNNGNKISVKINNAQQNELNCVSKTPFNPSSEKSSDIENISDDLDKSTDPRDVLSKPISNTTSRIEVLSIEIDSPNEDFQRENSEENNSDNDMQEKPSKEALAPDIEIRDAESLPISTRNCDNESNKDTDRTNEVEISPEDIKVKIERKAEEVLREMNEMDADNLISTIIGIEDPFLVIEISSDSESEDDEIDIDEMKIPDTLSTDNSA